MKTSQSRDVLSSSSPWRRHRNWLFGVLAASCVPWAAFADAEAEARYPYDPACAWGRLSNGKGMLHRCLTEKEAKELAQANPGALARKSKAEGKGRPSPDDAEPTDDDQGVSEAAGGYELTIGPIAAEQGDITIGALDKPKDRYRKCVDDNGGLQGAEAQVVVKFLVRGERQRAEGVAVKSVEGVSEKAARCIAYVVDRRRVGTPSVPLTGAELTFQFSKAENPTVGADKKR